jgi:hypothetical protein
MSDNPSAMVRETVAMLDKNISVPLHDIEALGLTTKLRINPQVSLLVATTCLSNTPARGACFGNKKS